MKAGLINGTNLLILVLVVLTFAVAPRPHHSGPGATPSTGTTVSIMAPCANEDGPGPCYWDAQTRGNGKGQSFWIDSQGQVHR